MRFAILLLTLLLIPALALGQTEITSLPTTLSVSGSYYLNGNLSYSGTSNAITVSANNVSIDGNGFTITHSGTAGDIVNFGTQTGFVLQSITLNRSGGGSGHDCIEGGAGSDADVYAVRTHNSGTSAGACLRTAGTIEAESCIFARNNSGSVSVVITGSGTRVLTNCTVYAVAANAMTVASGGTLVAKNSIFIRSTGTSVVVNDSNSSGSTYSHNLYWSTAGTNLITYNLVTYNSGNITSLDANAQTGDPNLLNPDGSATANWRPKSTSTKVLNNGSNVNSFSIDASDSTRVIATTIDRGAHERQSAPTPQGACCVPNPYGYGTCSVTTEVSCTGGGGTYQGDDTTCSPSPCPYVPRFAVVDDAPILMTAAEAATQYDRCTNAANPAYPYLNQVWVSVKGWVDAQDTSNDSDATDAAEMILNATIYRMTGTSSYLTRAMTEWSNLAATAETYTPGPPVREIEGSVLSNQSAKAYTYSLIRHGLTPSQRKTYRNELLALDTALAAAPGEANDPWRWHNTSITTSLVVLGDTSGTQYDQAKLDNNAGFVKDWCGPCLEENKGYFEDYSGQKGVSMLATGEAIERTVTGWSSPELAKHLDEGWQFWASRVRGEILDAGGTEGRLAIERQAGKHDVTDINFGLLFSYYSGPRQQPIAAAWLREFLDRDLWNPAINKDTALSLWPIVVWGDPALGVATIQDTPRLIYQPMHGITHVRQGWEIGDNSKIAINFWAFTVRFAAETSWGGIMIRRGEANGTIRSSYRLIDYDRVYTPHHNRTIAASSIRIYDAAEGIYAPETIFIDQWKGAAIDTGSDGVCTNNVYRTSTPPNDGGGDIYALDGANPDWEAAAKVRVPECAHETNPGYTIQGTTLAWEGLEGVYWRQVASGDSAYAQTKQTGVKRSVSYLWDSSVLVVDEVVNDKASTPVFTDWHFPRVARFGVDDASITRVAGCDTIGVGVNDVAADPPGGNYTAAVSSNYLRTVNGDSQFIYTPLFQGTLAGGSTPVLELAGGPNRKGVHSKQNDNQNDVASYNPSNPSFEFDIFGVNRMPGSYSCADFPTTLPDGAYPVPAEGVRRLADYPPPYWNDDPTVSDGIEAGSWRGSSKTTPAAANDTVLTVTHVWAGDAAILQADRPKAGYAKRGGTIAVIYDADDTAGEELKLSIQRVPRLAGQRLSSFSWTKPTASFAAPGSVAHVAFGGKPSWTYLVEIDTDGNGTFDTPLGTYTSDGEGVLRFSRAYAGYSAGRAVGQGAATSGGDGGQQRRFRGLDD